MMLTPARVVAIDDDAIHLAGLTKALSRHGAACLQIHITGDLTGIEACPDVRIIFADLHLGAGTPSGHNADFAAIGGLLEHTIKPCGPYFIVLWTQYPDQAQELRRFLDERLQGVEKPFDVRPLDKAQHLGVDGTVRDEIALISEIVQIVEAVPEIGALLNWESRVLEAAGNTVSSISALTSAQEADKRADKVGVILATLGIEAVGKTHVETDRFRAVNEALLPILADRIAGLRSGKDAERVWQAALAVAGGGQDLSAVDAAKLNRLVHIADPLNVDGSDRGVVVLLPEPWRRHFKRAVGIDEGNVAQEEYRCKDFTVDDAGFRWVLVQCQAACDHAQSQRGRLPYYLGLDFSESKKIKGKQPPDAVWTSPAFEFDGEIRLLRVSSRFPISRSSVLAEKETPLYRLREQILNDLTYHIHRHGARPGKISFTGT